MKIEQLCVSLADTTRVDARLRQDAGIAFGPDAQLQILPPQGDEILFTSDRSVPLPVAWLPSHFGPPTAPSKTASARRQASIVAAGGGIISPGSPAPDTSCGLPTPRAWRVPSSI